MLENITPRSYNLHAVVTALAAINEGLPPTLRITGYYPHYLCDRCTQEEGTFSVQNSAAKPGSVYMFLCEMCLDVVVEAEETYQGCITQ